MTIFFWWLKNPKYYLKGWCYNFGFSPAANTPGCRFLSALTTWCRIVASAVCSVGQFPVQCNIWRYSWIAPCFLQRSSVKPLWLSDDAFISLQRQKWSHLIPNCKTMKMEGQKMCSCLIWDYKFLKVYYYQWETRQCFCMIARQLIWVKKGQKLLQVCRQQRNPNHPRTS